MARSAADVINEAYKEWFKLAVAFTVTVVQDRYLSGPRPSRLGEKTGRLKRTLKPSVRADGFAISTGEPQGIYWEFGTASRVIEAKPGRVLAIRLREGSVIYRKKVYVPEQEPRKWLEPGVREALPEAVAMAEVPMGKALEVIFADRTLVMGGGTK